MKTATPRIDKCILSLLVAMGFAGVSFAQQFDAEYLVREKQFGEQWASEDKQIREKLTALEKKYGKKLQLILAHRLELVLVVVKDVVTSGFSFT